MKKIITITLILTLSTVMSAQINPHAIGMRFGGSNSFGAEISYQRGFTGSNRLEVDLGLRARPYYSSFALTGVYQWVWPIQNSFQWYAGPGAQIGSWSYDDDYKYKGDGGTWLAIMGQIGVEYQFDFPLQLSIDLRPGIAFGNAYGDIFDLALGVRYTF
ncbi:MAG: hypothetical protein JW717_02450 [Marinilabiliaceae bacterium]|nr:hypothetical protein [Marinilabiliaceae bacterium]